MDARTVGVVLVAGLLGGSLPATAEASQKATLSAAFSPNELGVNTTFDFGFRIASTDGSELSPIVDMNLHLPSGIGLATSSLGLANCDPAALWARGLTGCSPNARIGLGSAVVEVPFEQMPVYDTASITALMGPPDKHHVVLLFFADAQTPISARLVFPARLLPDRLPFGEFLDTSIAPIQSAPEGPNVALVSFRSSIGPRHLVYHERVGGRTVSYKPKGMSVPRTCPAGGFPVGVTFDFQNGDRTSAGTTIPCP